MTTALSWLLVISALALAIIGLAAIVLADYQTTRATTERRQS